MKQGKVDLVSGGFFSANPEGVGPAASGRRAKIICTIGPASNSEAAMSHLMRLGMDVARLNFSHGSHAEHARNIQRLRRAAKKIALSVSCRTCKVRRSVPAD